LPRQAADAGWLHVVRNLLEEAASGNGVTVRVCRGSTG
jgi:hypothetical protein